MNDFLIFKILESVEQLDGKATDKTKREAIKVVQFEELVQIQAHQLEANAEVLSKDDEVFHVDDVHRVIGVVLFQKLKDFKFYASLVIILLLIFYDFKRDWFFCLVVEALECDSEGSFP